MTLLDPTNFTNMLAHKVYDGLGKKYKVQIVNLFSEGDAVLPSLLVTRNGSVYYASPLMQLYVDYVNIFHGDINRLCENECKKIEEFDEFTHSQDEIEVIN